MKEPTPEEIEEMREFLESASAAVTKFAEVIAATITPAMTAIVAFWESLPDEIKGLYEDEGDLER